MLNVLRLMLTIINDRRSRNTSVCVFVHQQSTTRKSERGRILRIGKNEKNDLIKLNICFGFKIL